MIIISLTEFGGISASNFYHIRASILPPKRNDSGRHMPTPVSGEEQPSCLISFGEPKEFSFFEECVKKRR